MSGAGRGLRARAKRTGARVGNIQLAMALRAQSEVYRWDEIVRDYCAYNVLHGAMRKNSGSNGLRAGTKQAAVDDALDRHPDDPALEVGDENIPPEMVGEIDVAVEEDNFLDFQGDNSVEQWVPDNQKIIKDKLRELYGLTSKAAHALSLDVHLKAVRLSSLAEFSDNAKGQNLIGEFERLTKNPPLYRERTNYHEKPTEFYERVWKRFADAGLIYQDELRRIDEQLLNRVRHYCAVNDLRARSFMPPPRQERTKRQAALGDRQAIAKLVQNERQRNGRRAAPKPK